MYIYNAIEIQIIDQDMINRLPHRPPSKDGKLVYWCRKDPKDVNATMIPCVPELPSWLITGIPYGIGNVQLGTDGRLPNPLKPRGQCNEMTVIFKPKHRSPQNVCWPNGTLLGGHITVTVNGKTTYDDDVTQGTGSKAKTPLSWVIDSNVYLQSHCGSHVSFADINIETLSNGSGAGGPTVKGPDCGQ